MVACSTITLSVKIMVRVSERHLGAVALGGGVQEPRQPRSIDVHHRRVWETLGAASGGETSGRIHLLLVIHARD